jgi:hypothetical protein
MTSGGDIEEVVANYLRYAQPSERTVVSHATVPHQSGMLIIFPGSGRCAAALHSEA